MLALVAEADPSLSPIFTRYGIDHERLKNTVLQALASKKCEPENNAIDAILLPSSFDENRSAKSSVPWAASWDNKPAVGMPRKFSIAILMMMVTLFAMLFSALRWIGALPVYYGIFGVLVFGVALGQTLLFGGKYPRAASIWSGAILLPVQIGVIYLFTDLLSDVFYSEHNVIIRGILVLFFMLFSVPFGAFFGYLAGGLSAGVVLLLELKKEKDPQSSDGTFFDSDPQAEE